MTTRFNHHTAALALAVFTTLAIFSGVSSLSQAPHSGALLAQVQADTPQT